MIQRMKIKQCIASFSQMKDINDIIISVYIEKDMTNFKLFISTLNKLGLERNYFDIIKSTQENSH